MPATRTPDTWIEAQSAAIASRFARELAALVAVSSPSGDVRGAEEAVAVATAITPDGAEVERLPCSTTGAADDLLLRLTGSGQRRVMLLGHLDTVIPHGEHKTLRREDDRLVGSGSVDMKGGDVFALGVARALAERPELYAELAVLLVVDEEWRTEPFGHVERFAGWDACLCFEAGERDPAGNEAVVARRKAAATVEIVAHGRSAHSGVEPDAGDNALLALVAVAEAVAAHHDPSGHRDRLSAVPTLMRAGEGLNVVPATGEMTCDLRADHERAFAPVVSSLPAEHDGVRIESQIGRLWPGMDSREHVGAVLESASKLCGTAIVTASRGGASDASHFAATIPVTLDGLGPCGGGAHAPEEHVDAASVEARARVALAITVAALGG